MDEEHPNGSLKKPKTPKQRIKEGLLMSAIAEARVSDLPSAAKLRTVKWHRKAVAEGHWSSAQGNNHEGPK